MMDPPPLQKLKKLNQTSRKHHDYKGIIKNPDTMMMGVSPTLPDSSTKTHSQI
jgi:hypothetical protein